MTYVPHVTRLSTVDNNQNIWIPLLLFPLTMVAMSLGDPFHKDSLTMWVYVYICIPQQLTKLDMHYALNDNLLSGLAWSCRREATTHGRGMACQLQMFAKGPLKIALPSGETVPSGIGSTQRDAASIGYSPIGKCLWIVRRRSMSIQPSKILPKQSRIEHKDRE